MFLGSKRLASGHGPPPPVVVGLCSSSSSSNSSNSSSSTIRVVVYNVVLPVVPHKAVAEVSRIGNV